jgi:isoquinoline 1-oxidoreductase beta subunit
MHFYSKNNMPSNLSELPKGIAAMIQKNHSHTEATSFSRRNFLKMSAASGFALGMFPAIAQTDKPAAGLKAFQQPAAFVQISKDGKVIVTTAWNLAKGYTLPCL